MTYIHYTTKTFNDRGYVFKATIYKSDIYSDKYRINLQMYTKTTVLYFFSMKRSVGKEFTRSKISEDNLFKSIELMKDEAIEHYNHKVKMEKQINERLEK